MFFGDGANVLSRHLPKEIYQHDRREFVKNITFIGGKCKKCKLQLQFFQSETEKVGNRLLEKISNLAVKYREISAQKSGL
jgi:hypothetical protein